jgi:hypothetical protein
MHQTSLVADSTVTADEDILRDGLSKDLDFQNVGDDFLCLSIDIWVNQGDVVVACDHISKCTESLFDSL